MHEKDENLPSARMKYKRLYILDQFLRVMVYLTTFYVIFIKLDIINKAIHLLSF